MKPVFFTASFIEQLMREHAPEKNIKVKAVHPFSVDSSASILVMLTAGRTEIPIGHFGLAVTYEANGEEQTCNMVLKIKPHGRDIVGMLNSLSFACGEKLSAVYEGFKHLTGFQHTHVREQEVYKKFTNKLAPEIFGLQTDEALDSYLVLMEYLEEVELMNSVMAPEQWTDTHIREALSQIAAWHAANLGKPVPLDAHYSDDAPSVAFMQKLSPLWQALLAHAACSFPTLYTEKRVSILQDAIDHIPAYWQELEAMPKTQIHNDLNPRNTCFKRTDSGLAFCVYDWELSTQHVPQYDVVELLSFVLDEDRYHLREEYLEHYRKALHALTNLYEDKQVFMRGVELAALDFGLHRLGLYMMAHAVSPYPFLPRVVSSYFNLLEQAIPFNFNDAQNKTFLMHS